ncbi:hypothetical protein F5Y09DRAFT_340258 [Xylaria sp. FL1042]|nr:hypothetical protein F5Y09DRAFT_340258 [Xylaria sp. FL1042]
MWSKFTFGFLSAVAVATTLGIIATTVRAATPAEPEAVVALLHTYTSQGLCHCVRKRYSMAVDETATGRCLSLPRDFKPGAVEVTGDWNVFVFETADCSDKGGWVFPKTTQNSAVCNYNLGDVKAYAVLGTDHGKFDVGDRRGKIDQFCGSDGQ